MTIRQRILKKVYPLLLRIQKGNAKTSGATNEVNTPPPHSFYSLSATLNSGKTFSFEALRGKKVLLVNTASDCGYTPQYAELQTLYEREKSGLEIIAFPANDFKEQEKGADEDIARFCAVNYGVSFPLAKKSVVVKAEAQHPVFQWLTQKGKNGWSDAPPSWNFSKFLVNEKGVLTNYFGPAVSPLSNEVAEAVHKKAS